MDSFHRNSSSSAADRLSAFRQSSNDGSEKQGASWRKNDLLMGVVVIVVGIAVVALVLLRPAKEQAVVGEQVTEPVVTPSSNTQLLADEALIALSVEIGHYPPQLVVGDAVRIAVTPGIDGSSDTRVLPEDAVVAEISSAGDVQANTVITVRAPRSVLASIASSGPIHVAKVGGADQ